MMDWTGTVLKTMRALLLTGGGNIIIGLSVAMLLFTCIIILTVFIFRDIFSKPECTGNSDESLLILHIADKCNTADMTFSDLVACLEEKGFSIEEYCAIRRISFERMDEDSKKYHSLFKKMEKLMQEENSK